MIPDVLHEALSEIHRYLTDPAFKSEYAADDRMAIAKVVRVMDALRNYLDLLDDPRVSHETARTARIRQSLAGLDVSAVEQSWAEWESYIRRKSLGGD